MNVLLFTLEYPPFKGGVAKYYENLVGHWPKQDNIFVLANGENAPIQNNIKYSKIIFNHIYPKWLPSIFKLLAFVKKYKINYILVGHILPLGLATFIVSKFTKINYTVIIHGMDFSFTLKSERKKYLSRLILKNSKRIICGNSYVADMVKDFLGNDCLSKVSIVNPGINPDIKKDDTLINEIIKKYNLEHKIIALSIGRLVKRKGFDKTIEAMTDLNNSLPNLQYVLAGKGPDESYIKQFEKNSQNIIYIDNFSDEEKWAWMFLCDFFIMPSRNINGDFEGFGIVYLEANLAGKPVIAGNSGGVGDAVIDNFNGILVNPDNINEIKKAIIKLSNDKDLRNKLGSQGQKRAIKEFNWSQLTYKIYQVINQ